MRTILFLAIALWVANVAPSHADERFVLRGIGTGHPRVTITLGPGSELARCSNASETIMRCVLIDAVDAESTVAGIARQVETQGFVATQPRPGAAPGVRVFAPVETSVRCPHIVMIVPDTEGRLAAAPPEGKRLFVVSYATDLHCLAEAMR